ncbi:hypothetical protein [Acidaminobacter hydrogenoformans]|uniref:Antitoxin of toxin-antitoxin, RelE / RelB, TA system n=1 Tax=Acidaminobacter hydrogenoformans DSM 2784 TaxID=1120920 RepID=A0A1G5RVQ9_9FIRM|nr:hypothetical protein [Acidaminobacter hydrogenoformans]SCZ78126.1 Antitoxin of toxin-antitoxin, RelE / RelB, TA system [Acidaminobacter hydrogenoformans DSM 2784]
MNQPLNATEVRKHWSEFIDSVVRNKPAQVKRNRDLLAVLSMDQLEALLESQKIKICVIQEEDGTFTGSIDNLDLAANESSIEQLKQTLLQDLVEYASEYMDNFDLYFKSPNRKAHFPYVYKVNTLIDSTEQLKEEVEIYRGDKNNA